MLQRLFNLFVLFSALISLLLLLPFFLIRRKRPSTLKFNPRNGKNPSWRGPRGLNEEPTGKNSAPKGASSPFQTSSHPSSSFRSRGAYRGSPHGSHRGSHGFSGSSRSSASPRSGPQEINVLFEHDTKTYDAYELLNLPAGSSLVEAQKQCKKLLEERALSTEKRHLLKRALDCVSQKTKGGD